jgi:Ca-activated chloride channel family protein
LGLIEDGTAIGSALMSAVSRVKDVEAKSKIIILLTDGINNRGNVEPLKAAEIARNFNIRVYTIGVDSRGLVPYPATDFFGRRVYRKEMVPLDEDVLKRISDLTNGRYFRATDSQSLRNIYQQIDKLEKSEVEKKGYREYKELFAALLIVALVLLAFDVIMRGTFLMTLP